MKACFFLQRRFAYLSHAMALTLKKKYGIDKFCGYVHVRSSLKFLESQNEITYTKLLLDEDIHKQYKNEPLNLDYLKYLEKEYGLPNLWPYIEIDRITRYNLLLREYPYNTPKYTHEEMMRILQVKAKAVIKFLNEEKPDFLILSVIGSISIMFLYHVARKMGIRTFLIRGTRIGTTYSITENYENLELEYAEKTFDEIQKNSAPYRNYIMQAEKFLNEFRDKPSSYAANSPEAKPITRKGQFGFLLSFRMFISVSWFIKMIYEYFSDKNRDDYSNIKPWHYVLDRIKRKIRVLIGFDDLYDEINLKEDFAYFPLHFEPEMTTMFFAPFYTDQLWLIKQIARSLPIHYKLYTKEHPAMLGYRTRKFYKELRKIPNVKLIKPTGIIFDLIKNAKLVITITGTVGLEAMMFKKSVITFGNASFNKLPMVKKCRAIEELPLIVKEQIENFNHDEKALVNFIAAVYKESVDVNIPQLWNVEGGGKMDKKEKELVPLVDLIAEKLDLKPIADSA